MVVAVRAESVYKERDMRERRKLKAMEIQQVSMSTGSMKAADVAWNGGVRVVES